MPRPYRVRPSLWTGAMAFKPYEGVDLEAVELEVERLLPAPFLFLPEATGAMERRVEGVLRALEARCGLDDETDLDRVVEILGIAEMLTAIAAAAEAEAFDVASGDMLVIGEALVMLATRPVAGRA